MLKTDGEWLSQSAVAGEALTKREVCYGGEIVSTPTASRFEALWSVEQVAEYLLMSTKTLYGWRCRKVGPPSYRLGNKVRYRPDEVRAWVAEHRSDKVDGGP